ncbi:MAG: hypothetical protein JW786_11695 [Desulfobacterales bacterium]|nr:hypothetical protein [Desulfobacterales bacterium]
MTKKKNDSDMKKEEIRRFADQITPKNWNVVLHPKDDKLSANILNILLRIQDSDYPDSADTAAKAVLSGGILFSNLKDIGIDQKGSVAQVVLQLWPRSGDWKAALIHELARVAVYRCLAFRMKTYKDEPRMTLPEADNELEPHGVTFEKALSIMKKRSRKIS